MKLPPEHLKLLHDVILEVLEGQLQALQFEDISDVVYDDYQVVRDIAVMDEVDPETVDDEWFEDLHKYVEQTVDRLCDMIHQHLSKETLRENSHQ